MWVQSSMHRTPFEYRKRWKTYLCLSFFSQFSPSDAFCTITMGILLDLRSKALEIQTKSSLHIHRKIAWDRCKRWNFLSRNPFEGKKNDRHLIILFSGKSRHQTSPWLTLSRLVKTRNGRRIHSLSYWNHYYSLNQAPVEKKHGMEDFLAENS